MGPVYQRAASRGLALVLVQALALALGHSCCFHPLAVHAQPVIRVLACIQVGCVGECPPHRALRGRRSAGGYSPPLGTYPPRYLPYGLGT